MIPDDALNHVRREADAAAATVPTPVPTLAEDIAEVRRPHNFDGPDAPYNPELLIFIRAADRIADELERRLATERAGEVTDDE